MEDIVFSIFIQMIENYNIVVTIKLALKTKMFLKEKKSKERKRKEN
jgi:hypothetical protein